VPLSLLPEPSVMPSTMNVALRFFGHSDISTCCCAWEAFERHSFIFSHIAASAPPWLVDLWQSKPF
jgi:hypothetical protein